MCLDESASVDTIRNVLKLMEKWEVVECHNQDRIKLYYLGREYEREGSVEQSGANSLLTPVIERIRQFQWSAVTISDHNPLTSQATTRWDGSFQENRWGMAISSGLKYQAAVVTT